MINENQVRDIETRILAYIREKKAVVAFELLREFNDLLGESPEEKSDNIVRILGNLRERHLIETPFTDEKSAIGPLEAINIKLKETE